MKEFNEALEVLFAILGISFWILLGFKACTNSQHLDHYEICMKYGHDTTKCEEGK